MNKLILILIEKRLIFSTLKMNHRIEQELYSLKQCEGRKGYLALYDSGIRHCFLLVLKKGYDIPSNKVHLVFKVVLNYLAGLDHNLSTEIVQARHRLKYCSSTVGPLIVQALKRCIVILRDYQSA